MLDWEAKKDKVIFSGVWDDWLRIPHFNERSTNVVENSARCIAKRKLFHAGIYSRSLTNNCSLVSLLLIARQATSALDFTQREISIQMAEQSFATNKIGRQPVPSRGSLEWSFKFDGFRVSAARVEARKVNAESKSRLVPPRLFTRVEILVPIFDLNSLIFCISWEKSVRYTWKLKTYLPPLARNQLPFVSFKEDLLAKLAD